MSHDSTSRSFHYSETYTRNPNTDPPCIEIKVTFVATNKDGAWRIEPTLMPKNWLAADEIGWIYNCFLDFSLKVSQLKVLNQLVTSR